MAIGHHQRVFNHHSGSSGAEAPKAGKLPKCGNLALWYTEQILVVTAGITDAHSTILLSTTSCRKGAH